MKNDPYMYVRKREREKRTHKTICRFWFQTIDFILSRNLSIQDNFSNNSIY